ncbi:MAG: hypothetical protein KJO82_11960, partial [Gammaproteobacteria bacterium]|nr:hypothetical protein [Gammaproteobacteria bacterium]
VTSQGPIALGGSVNFELTGGFNPAPCQLFEFIQYPDFSGSFATITGPDFGGGETFAVGLGATAATAITPGQGCR